MKTESMSLIQLFFTVLLMSSLLNALPLSPTTTDSTPAADLMKICQKHDDCRCLNGISICHNYRCYCVYASQYDIASNNTEHMIPMETFNETPQQKNSQL